jgi:hypothetical protein
MDAVFPLRIVGKRRHQRRGAYVGQRVYHWEVGC